MPIQKPEAFRFTMKNNCQLVLYGDSKKEALMGHLITGTRRAGHQISQKEADDPGSDIILVNSEEYLEFYETFEQAAEEAWGTVSVPQESKNFRFQMNDGNSLTISGKSKAKILMEHLVSKTKEIGHCISFEEAEDPRRILMVKPSEYVLPFGSFEAAAKTAYERTQD